MQCDINEEQRSKLTQYFTLKGIKINEYQFDDVCTALKELFSNPANQYTDPHVRPRRSRYPGPRIFYAEEQGYLVAGGQHIEGAWAVDAQTGFDVFLSNESDVMYYFDEDARSRTYWTWR